MSQPLPRPRWRIGPEKEGGGSWHGDRARRVLLPGLWCGTAGLNSLGLDLGCCPGLRGQRTCLPELRSQTLAPHAGRVRVGRWTPGGHLRTRGSGNSKCRESFFERQLLESSPDLLGQTWLSHTYSSSGASSLEVSWTLDKGFLTDEAWMVTPLLVDSTLGLEDTLGSQPGRLPASS